MLDTTTQKEIAVRLYENKKYGATYGKGKYRTAIYNGTADVKHPNHKYLLDFFTYEDWRNMAKTNEQMKILEEVDSYKDTLYTWIHFYDTSTKNKSLKNGMGILYLDEMNVRLFIEDLINEIDELWNLEVKACRINSNFKNPPQLLATNSDLSLW